MPPRTRGGMPPRRRRSGRDRSDAPTRPARHSLDALPDDVLHHVLSFLPAQEAVRTCVLARRWRNLWKSVTGLRILCGQDHAAKSVTELREFVDHLLLLRGFSPLDTFELEFYVFEDEDIPHMYLWIRHVLMCKVRVLSLSFCRSDLDPWFGLDNKMVLVSQHLKKLQLSNLRFSDSFLAFSSCPALEALEFNDCEFLDCHRISSESLKFLSFRGHCDFGRDSHPHICAPNLISLWLQVCCGNTPLLERMPFLVEAVVKINSSQYQYGAFTDSDSGVSDDEDCSARYSVHGDTHDCTVLQAVSEAQSLVLISYISEFISRRELKCCPTFGNLKTLLLNECWCWCMPGDFSSLTCILEHSPVLEKLTLELFCMGSKSKVEMKGSPDPTERSNAISEHLKIVEVKCEVVDEKVLNVLNILSKLSICSILRNRKGGRLRFVGIEHTVLLEHPHWSLLTTQAKASKFGRSCIRETGKAHV